MVPHKKVQNQASLFSTFEDILDHRHPLYILADRIRWEIFEDAFLPLYSVVEQWSENIYYQNFCGENTFVPGPPCEVSELVHFRKRIGEAGIELVLKESIRVNGEDDHDGNVNIDTTVQKKNITFPTDSKLHGKIIKKCKKITEQDQLPVRQTYTRTLKKLSVDPRFRNHPRNKSKARKADKKIKTIAGRLFRELERNLPPNSGYQIDLDLFKQILSQTKSSKNKIYSLHEPEVCCISKGKEHKKYEFGNKAFL